jgi:zinc protease
MRCGSRLLSLVPILLAPPGHAQLLHVTPPPLAVSQQTEPNALTLLMCEDHHVPVVSVEVWYHVGSKNEPPGRTGFAHLFEHLMFKGSAHLAAEEHSHYIESIGGRVNASTDFDATRYYEVFPSNYLERILWMEADRMRSLDVSEANFRAEREVVKEERRLRLDEPPFGHLNEIVFAAAYATHPYHNTPIGSMADLDAATIADVRDFHRTFYVPDNATIVITGDFAPAQARRWVASYFGSIPRGTRRISRTFPAELPQSSERRRVVHDAQAPLPAVVLAFHIPSEKDPDFFALDVASNLLSAGESSRLYQSLVYAKQIAVAAGGETVALEDPGLFYFYAILQNGQTAEAGEAALTAEADRLRNELVGEAELTKAKNQFISHLVFDRATLEERGSAIAHAAVILGDWTWVNREMAQYAKVTAADVQRVARKYFVPTNRTVVHMLPPAATPGAGKEQP